MRAVVLLCLLMAIGRPAAAQIDLSGNWGPPDGFQEDQEERRQPGPAIGDYLGLPINDAARQWALSWDPSRLTLPEHQCQVHVSPYIYRGPMQLRIWDEKDPVTQQVIAQKHYIRTWGQTRTIWMDGRPHPPAYAAHTWMGFSTGKWEGDMLTVTTTHIKQGWLRRNGVPESDEASLVEHFVRHGNYLTRISVISDPVYLTEPLVKSDNFVLNLNQDIDWLYLSTCEYEDEIPNRKPGSVPHYLPGRNPFVSEFAVRVGLPLSAVMGGAPTMYPEFARTLGTH